MKKFLFLCLLIAHVSYGQIFTQSGGDNSILITPKGLQGSTNSTRADTTNVALGSSALKNNISGPYNSAFGNQALYSNTIGGGNTANGYQTLYKNTIGVANTAIGMAALFGNTEGNGNTAIGEYALVSNRLGYYNTAVGGRALYSTNLGVSINIGNNNTALGYYAGHRNVTGGGNTFVGYYSNTTGTGYESFQNAMALGAFTEVNASNKVRIGNDQVTVIEGAVPFSTPSDRRLKQNIAPSSLGLSFISRLSPMSYTYIADKTNVRRDGLIAQDVEKVMQELGVEFSGLQKSPDGTYSLAYSDFVMPLVNAVKEQQDQIKEQQTEINDLKKKLSRMEELEKRLNTIEASLSATPTGK